MDDSALKSTLDGLNASHGRLEGWLAFWTWMVIVGVACELVFILWDHWEGIQEWRQSLTRAMTPLESRPNRWKLIFELLSVALVVAGIAGELRIDAMLGDLDTRIQGINNQRLALLQTEAGDAAKSAHDAGVDAGIAKGDAHQADLDAGSAKRKAGNVERQTNRLRQLQAEAEDAQARLNRALFQFTMPRLQPYDPGGHWIAALKKLPKWKAEIRYKRDDGQAFGYASNLARELNDAGWTVVGPNSTRTRLNGTSEDLAPIVGSSAAIKQIPTPDVVMRSCITPDWSGASPARIATCIAGVDSFTEDKSLPDNTVVILIGERFQFEEPIDQPESMPKQNKIKK